MYLIRLRNCSFYAFHGALPEEAVVGQRFHLDVELAVEAPEALETDRVEATVHYGEVFAAVEAIVTGKRFNLIEALAHEVARSLAARFPAIRRAEVTVRKPAAPVRGILDHVEVVVVWPG